MNKGKDHEACVQDGGHHFFGSALFLRRVRNRAKST
jgi:hypothetical protein